MRLYTKILAALATVAAIPAAAQDDLEIIGVPTPDAIGFQPAATELARDVQWLDNLSLIHI